MKSVWEYARVKPSFPCLEGDQKTQVLIIGGGLAGVLTAYMLEKAGVDHLLIEAGELCSGVTRNTTAKITSQHGLIYGKLLEKFGGDTARLYWQANEAALEGYRQICREVSCDFERRDAYVYSKDRPDKLEGEMAALQRLGIPAEFVEQTELPFPVAGAVRFRNQAQFHPLKFLTGIVRGLNIREHTRAISFDGKGVVTDRGRITAEHLVVATHFPVFNKHGAYFLKMYQDRSYVLALEGAGGLKGMYLDEAKGGLSFRDHKGLLLVGGGAHRTGKKSTGWDGPEAAKAYYPHAREVCRWATQDCMTLDGMPYIGQYSAGTPGLYTATGFNKWGMTSSMVAAALLCDLIQGKENPFAEVFKPSRTMLRGQLLVNALEAARGWVTFSKPRCPHMGCALTWNPRERSWDCPCHGSRFSGNGTLLDNPATGDLKE